MMFTTIMVSNNPNIPPKIVAPTAKISFYFTISFLLVGSARVYLLDFAISS